MTTAARDLLAGLSDAEARERLEREGFNELPRDRRQSLFRVAWSVLREPMFAMLVAAAAIYGFIGDLAEALLLLAFATISVTIAVIQRGRSERALEALRDLASPRALVLREGRRQRIAGRDVVRDDLVIISEGDRVPADGVIVAGDHIEVDESLLTGESMPVRKSATATLPDPAGGVELPAECRVFGGTLVVRGTGRVLILATGPRSAFGTIGQSLASLTREAPRLEQETRRLVWGFGIAALLFCTATVVIYGLVHDDWLNAWLGGIALGMALLPEEFPLVLTVFMVMGAWRLSRSRVLTRRASAIEALGSATVLCTDKTGTLTRNVMTVAALECGGESWRPQDPPERIVESPALAELLEFAELASDDHRIDPMERAIFELRESVDTRRAAPASLLREYPLRPELLAVTRIWRGAAGDVVATKGAPEAIARLCGLDPAARAQQQSQVDALARKGIRVLAVARAPLDGPPPESIEAFRFRYLGLIGFADPLRASVPDAVRECREAGIRVVMITGDYPATASAIAAEAGIEGGTVITGTDVATLSDTELCERARSAAVFARISPGQKLRIVEALKSAGEVVAMTGDGVNDAPALKAAHIGIAMGGRGTDVAREASSIVLLDDDFGSIVRAIRVGRRIYDNLRKAMGYILAIHVPIAGLALLPVLFGWPLVLTPVLIALLELIIDPACSVVLEAEEEEPGIMNRPPRAPDSSLLSPSLLRWSLFQGVAAFLTVGAVYMLAVRADLAADSARTLAFLTLVGVNIALIFVNRTFASSLREAFGRPNRMLWVGLGVAALVLLSIAVLPTWRGFFGLAILQPVEVGYGLAAVAVLLLALESIKGAWRRQLEH